MTLSKLLLSLVATGFICAGVVLSAQVSQASITQVWVEGLVLTKAGRVARNADLTIRDRDGNKLMATTTNAAGYFVLTELPITDEAYTVVAKHGGDTYRYDLLVDDSGHLGHQAILIRLAHTETAVVDLADDYTYYRSGMRTTASEGKIVYLETRTPESDYPYTTLYSYRFKTGQVRRLDSLMDEIGLVPRNALDFSADGEHLATASDQTLTIWQVTTVDRELRRTLDGDEYFSAGTGLLSNYEVEWVDSECVQAAVYQADPDDDTAERDFLEYRTYCLT